MTQPISTHSTTRRDFFYRFFLFRELFFFLFWRDFLIRYKQTFFGILWGVFRPILNILAFSFVFGRFAKLPSHDLPYPLFVFAGLLPWQWFAGAVQDGTYSLIVQSQLLTKVSFPRAFLPISLVLINGVDCLIGFFLLSPFLLLYFSGFSLLWLPLVLGEVFLLSSAVSLLFSAWTVYFRDFKIVVPFFLQLGIFLSPVGYTSMLVPSPWCWLYALNPLVGIIDGMRYALFEISHPMLFWNVMVSWIVTLFLSFWSVSIFKTLERGFADAI